MTATGTTSGPDGAGGRTRPRRAGLKDVARAAGVSTATVSYVLSGKRPVAEATSERVLRAVSELGYRKNLAAAALRDGVSQTLALLIPDITNPFYTELVVGAEEAAAGLGLGLELHNAQLDADREARYLCRALRSDCVGVVMAPLTTASLKPVTAVGDETTRPPVVVDEPVPGAGALRFSVDNAAGGALVAEHFAATGRRRGGAIGAPAGMPTSVARLEGFARRARQVGLEVPAANVTTAVRRTGDAVDAALAILDRDPAVDCFFAGDDLLAAHLLGALARRGTRVPHDVAVCGFDDIPWAELLSPSLTTVRQPARSLGRLAVEAVPRLRRGEAVADAVLPVELVVRGSTVPA